MLFFEILIMPLVNDLTQIRVDERVTRRDMSRSDLRPQWNLFGSDA